ncbi:DUF4384 domain-containing protein [Deinococcus sp.]|uniref:DUF4384 domain-containing protein n=1 Tax=Deinococcus sp. TaxID=47478 RepID=UPI0025C4EC72|nr:DUF4384 domain-containing protein [Deinococcus sp.]
MKKILSLTVPTALIASALIGSASATPRITAQSIIVNPVQTNVAVRVWVDRDPSGNVVPNYAPGERIHLYTSVDQDAYVYLFNVDPQGKVDLVLPNQLSGGQNFVKANTTKVFPDSRDNFTFDIAAPYGLNKVLALASTTPLNLDQIASFRSQQGGFATVNVQGQQQLAQALSIVVTPVAQNTWTSDTAYYNVVQGRPAQRPNPVQGYPVPTYPTQPIQGTYPWATQGQWSVYVDINTDSLARTHEQYANQLRSQGYRLVTIRQNGNHIRSEWQRGQQTALLEVKQQGGRYRVQIERDN